LNPDSTSGSYWWIVPGGGVRSGEELVEGARREVFEEVGIRLDSPMRHVLTRNAVFHMSGRMIRQQEYYYLVSISHLQSGEIRLNDRDEELARIDQFKWWSLEEIDTSTDVFIPGGIANMLRRSLSNPNTCAEYLSEVDE